MADTERRVYEHRGVPVLIIGDTGSGKSSMFGRGKKGEITEHIKGLPPEKTVIINSEDQEMPFEGARDYKVINVTSNKMLNSVLDRLAGEEGDKYDYVVMDSISASLELVETYTQYAFLNYEIWANYNEITKSIMRKIKALKQQVFVTGHPEQKSENFGEMKQYARIKGKELKYGYLEKQFIIVLFTRPVYDETTGFQTGVELVYQGNKFNTAKSPTGMFRGTLHNDARDIVIGIRKFYANRGEKEAVQTTTS